MNVIKVYSNETILCKTQKIEFIIPNDWNDYFKCIEFRPVMFQKLYKFNPNISYFNKNASKSFDCLNWRYLDEKLSFFNYHDREIVKICRYGMIYPRAYPVSGKNLLNDGMTYSHCDKNIVKKYFDNRLSGPYDLDQIKQLCKSPIIVGKILLIQKKDKSFRHVIDLRSHKIKFENYGNLPCKMRLPNLKQVFTYVDIFNTKAGSIVDFQSFYRQLPINSYNFGTSVLFYDFDNSKSFYIDNFAQMGHPWVAINAQRLTSSLNFIHNCLDSKNSCCLGYQDDTLIFHKNGNFNNSLNIFIDICENVGIKIKKSKLVVGQTIIKWLDINYNFQNQTLSPSTERLESLFKIIESFSLSKSCYLQEIQSFLGKISSFMYMNNCKSLIFKLRQLDSSSFKGLIKFKPVHLLELKLLKIALKALVDGLISFHIVNFIIKFQSKKLLFL